MLSGDIYQCFRDIVTLRANDLCAQIFGEAGVFLKSLGSDLALPGSISTVSEPVQELPCPGAIPCWLNVDGKQVCMQTMSQSPGFAYHLARVRSGIKTHKHAFRGGSEDGNVVLVHVAFELFLGLLRDAAQC